MIKIFGKISYHWQPELSWAIIYWSLSLTPMFIGLALLYERSQISLAIFVMFILFILLMGIGFHRYFRIEENQLYIASANPFASRKIQIKSISKIEGGSNTNSTEEFYNTSNSSTVEQSSVAVSEQTTVASTPEQSESTEASTDQAQEGETITVQPGEGVAAIAARAGISIAELERLNPEKMTTGSWLAHPGDVVRIK